MIAILCNYIVIWDNNLLIQWSLAHDAWVMKLFHLVTSWLRFCWLLMWETERELIRKEIHSNIDNNNENIKRDHQRSSTSSSFLVINNIKFWKGVAGDGVVNLIAIRIYRPLRLWFCLALARSTHGEVMRFWGWWWLYRPEEMCIPQDDNDDHWVKLITVIAHPFRTDWHPRDVV